MSILPAAAAVIVAAPLSLWPHKAEAEVQKIDASTFADILPAGFNGDCEVAGGNACSWKRGSGWFLPTSGMITLSLTDSPRAAEERTRKLAVDDKKRDGEALLIIRTKEISGIGDFAKERFVTNQNYHVEGDWPDDTWTFYIQKHYGIDFNRDCYTVQISFYDAPVLRPQHIPRSGPEPDDTVKLSAETIKSVGELALLFDKKLKSMPCGGVKPVVCKAPLPDPEQVDDILERAGKALTMFMQAPDPWERMPTPFMAMTAAMAGQRTITAPSASQLERYYAWIGAAQMARAEWDHVEGLLTRHHQYQLEISAEQTRRIKALAQTVSWLQQRADFVGRPKDAYDEFLKSKPRPAHPLFGPAVKGYYEKNDVPMPKDFRLIYDKSPEEIWREERWPAIIDTLRDWAIVGPLSVVDVYWTRGFLVSAYYAYRTNSTKPLGLTVALNSPAGPIAIALLAGYAAYSEYKDFWELSGPEHIANWTGFLLNSASTYQSVKMITGARKIPPESLPDVKKGINEGGVNPTIGKELGGRTWMEVGFKRIERLPGRGADVYQTFRFGKMVKDNGKFVPKILEEEFRVVEAVDGIRRYTVHPDGTLKDRVFFMNEEGYHAAKHLNEQNIGVRTDETPYTEVFEGFENFAAELAEIDAGFRDLKVPTAQPNARFAKWMSDVINEPYSPRLVHLVKMEQFNPRFPPENVHYFLVRSAKCGDKLVRFGVGTDGQIKGGFVLGDEKVAIGGEKQWQYFDIQMYKFVREGLPTWVLESPLFAGYLGYQR